MIRAHAGQRHARAVPRELGYHIANGVLWFLFLPVGGFVATILAGPVLYQLGA